MSIGRKKIFIICNGCSRRSLDANKLASYFRLNDCKMAKTPATADYIIFVTCSFAKFKEEQCFEAIIPFLKYKGELIVAGCLPEINPERLKQVFHGKVVATKDLNKIDEIFNFKIKFTDIPDAHLGYSGTFDQRLTFYQKLVSGIWFNKDFFKKALNFIPNKIKTFNKKQKVANLRIGSGCVELCSYCAIRRAIGKLKSKDVNLCTKEYSDVLKDGYREITFVADNLGAYGLDTGSNFADLLRSLSTIDSGLPVHWMFQDLHPKWVVKYKDILLEKAKEKKIMAIGCPLQSGSNRLLSLMNRHNTIEDITAALVELKTANPDLKIYTDIIVGFPSETKEDFFATLYAIEKIKIDHVSIYPYYEGYDTIAAKLEDKIDKETLKNRLKITKNFFEERKIEYVCPTPQELVDESEKLIKRKYDNTY